VAAKAKYVKGRQILAETTTRTTESLGKNVDIIGSSIALAYP